MIYPWVTFKEILHSDTELLEIFWMFCSEPWLKSHTVLGVEKKLNVSCEEVQIVSSYSFSQSLLPKKLSARDMYVNTHTCL